MRTIIAGSRDCTDKNELIVALSECNWIPTVVISGAAKGADRLGEIWAVESGVPVERFIADWNHYGKSAGYRRNVEMAENAEALIALWDESSRGTKHMIDVAKKKGLRVHVHLFNKSGVLNGWNL